LLSNINTIRFLPFSFVSSARNTNTIGSCVSTSLLLFSSSSNTNNYNFNNNNNFNDNMSEQTLLVKKLSEDATLPVRGSVWSAGYDLAASRPASIPPMGRAIVHTDLSIACPAGTYARIAPRSGLAIKKGIDVGAGVVDADYRGPVGVILFNLDPINTFEVQKGDRIAQLI
jgi:deoxyuridine 5'-triphosphate nucleotidohydrolase